MNKRTLSVCGAAMFLSLLVSSAFGYEKEIEQLSAQMAEKIAGKGKKTVAVVDFTDLEGNVTQLGRFIAEEFSVTLADSSKAFRVIDRTQLKRIIKEMNISSTGLIDPSTARNLGKIAGADALVVGNITPFDKNIRISLMLLDPETATVINASTVGIETGKVGAISELLANDLRLNSVSFDFPEKIEINSSASVRFSIDAMKEIEFLKREIRKKAKDLDMKVNVSNKIFASLLGSNFEIIGITPEMQIALDKDNMEWRWEIKPKSCGIHKLYLTISVVLNIEGENIQEQIHIFDKKIIVKATAFQQLIIFIKDNWQWLWATVLVPIIGLFLKKRKPKRRNAIS